jgi:pyruvate,water dikinase
VFKPTLKAGFRPILQKLVGTKKFKLVYDVRGTRKTKNVPVPVEDRVRFAEIFDGFSIGSNDRTRLTPGLDRDSEIVAQLFDERNEAVMRSIEEVIQRVRASRRKIGICGQAPSDYPEFARFLVSCGIDSISLNPDTVLKTTVDVLAMEKTLDPGPAPVPAQ